MGLNHFPDAVLALPLEIGIAHSFFGQASGMTLLPYQHSRLVAQVKKNLIIGIVGGAHGVCPQLPHLQKILPHGLRREGTAKLGMILMSAEAFDPELLAVHQDVLPFHPHLSETESVNQIVFRLAAFILKQGRCRIKPRRIRIPFLYIGADNLRPDFLCPASGQRYPTACAYRLRRHAL